MNGLRQTADGVVVGERENFDPGLKCRHDHSRRVERTIGVQGMTLEVEGWDGGLVSPGGQPRF